MRALFLSIILLFCMVFSVHANTVTITLFWSYSGNYNVQEGSVIQLVMFRTGSDHNPGSGVNNNFDAIGTYDGATVYDPYSVPNNHYIVYETAVEADIVIRPQILAYKSNPMTILRSLYGWFVQALKRFLGVKS